MSQLHRQTNLQLPLTDTDPHLHPQNIFWIRTDLTTCLCLVLGSESEKKCSEAKKRMAYKTLHISKKMYFLNGNDYLLRFENTFSRSAAHALSNNVKKND